MYSVDYPPDHLPDLWPNPKGGVVRPLRCLLQPDEIEKVPPVPAELRHQECLCGYFITDELVKTYWDTHPDARPGYSIANPKNFTVWGVSHQFGLDIGIDNPRDTDEGTIETIAWFAYTDYGKVYDGEVPNTARLAPFEKELGITERPRWLDTGFPVVCERSR
ncbi:hypothetical protein B0H16DRAFT_1550118 [Mycena metata]|uniref:Uncharacterized protein n=1 Tax=Mycena metata TaxID=1033252 RepID=A0AAD7IVR4_9AGAR|nr:hypothetical protein B0H16DRAFT_1550118 [Mycena metata]